MPGQVPLGEVVNATVSSGSRIYVFFSGSAQRDDLVPESAAPADACQRSSQLSAEDMLEYWREFATVRQVAARSCLVRGRPRCRRNWITPTAVRSSSATNSQFTAAFSALPEVAICPHEQERFGAEVLMNALRTRPGIIVGGMMHENPCYIEPGNFVAARG
jgi:hypothetical protein